MYLLKVTKEKMTREKETNSKFETMRSWRSRREKVAHSVTENSRERKKRWAWAV